MNNPVIVFDGFKLIVLGIWAIVVIVYWIFWILEKLFGEGK